MNTPDGRDIDEYVVRCCTDCGEWAGRVGEFWAWMEGIGLQQSRWPEKWRKTTQKWLNVVKVVLRQGNVELRQAKVAGFLQKVVRFFQGMEALLERIGDSALKVLRVFTKVVRFLVDFLGRVWLFARR